MYFLCSIFFICILSQNFDIASLSLAFYTITSHSVMFICPNCQCTFSSSRGLLIHCYTRNNDNNYKPLPSSPTTAQVNSPKHHSTNKTPINNTLQNIPSTKKQTTSKTNNSTQVDFNYEQS